MATVCHFLPHKPGVFAHTAEAIIWIFAAIDIECVILTYKECVAFNSLKRVPSDTYTVKLTGPFRCGSLAGRVSNGRGAW